MERESAVREILQSIGPLFPEDAQRARAARKQMMQTAEPETAAAAEPPVKFTTAPKPVLASQVDAPNLQKTEVASLASVLERLTPPPAAPSVRDTIPELVRVSPDVSALRAALDHRDSAEPVRAVLKTVAPEPVRAFVPTPAPEPVKAEPAKVEAIEPAKVEPLPVEATAEPVKAEVVAEVALAPEPVPMVEIETPATEFVALDELMDEPGLPHFTTFSEDDHDAFVAAVAEALELARDVETDEVVEAVAEPVVEPVSVEPAKPKTKRTKAKAKKTPAPEAEPVVTEPAPVLAVAEPEPDVTATSLEDDELIRQIRTHRADLIDVDDQLAKLDQAIEAEKQEMAGVLATIEQKNAHRARLVKLRTSTQRFVETLQVKAEPVKRTAKVKKTA